MSTVVNRLWIEADNSYIAQSILNRLTILVDPCSCGFFDVLGFEYIETEDNLMKKIAEPTPGKHILGRFVNYDDAEFLAQNALITPPRLLAQQTGPKCYNMVVIKQTNISYVPNTPPGIVNSDYMKCKIAYQVQRWLGLDVVATLRILSSVWTANNTKYVNSIDNILNLYFEYSRHIGPKTRTKAIPVGSKLISNRVFFRWLNEANDEAIVFRDLSCVWRTESGLTFVYKGTRTLSTGEIVIVIGSENTFGLSYVVPIDEADALWVTNTTPLFVNELVSHCNK